MGPSSTIKRNVHDTPGLETSACTASRARRRRRRCSSGVDSSSWTGCGGAGHYTGSPGKRRSRTLRTHLVAKAKSGKVTELWLRLSQLHLERAVEHFGAVRDLASITTADVRTWAERLQASGLSRGTVRHHLNALSNLYKRARAEHVVPSGYDPVADPLEKPAARGVEARWLEVPDAALLLDAARTYRPPRGQRRPLPFGYEVIATFLLTGGREAEVLGLEVADVSLDRGVVTFRPNSWRR